MKNNSDFVPNLDLRRYLYHRRFFLKGTGKGFKNFLFSQAKMVKLAKEKHEPQVNMARLSWTYPSDSLYQEKSLHSPCTNALAVTENCSTHLSNDLALVNLETLQHLLKPLSVSGSRQLLGNSVKFLHLKQFASTWCWMAKQWYSTNFYYGGYLGRCQHKLPIKSVCDDIPVYVSKMLRYRSPATCWSVASI